jgi:dihydrofolate synthase/folylpolyglutamate synthase
MVVLDVAHNEDGVRQILNQVELTDHHELHIIMGMVNDKEIDAVLRLLPATANYYFTQAKIPRALPSETLMNIAQRHGLQGKTYADVNMALDAARSAAGKQDLILVCGSVFLVAEVNRNGEQ